MPGAVTVVGVAAGVAPGAIVGAAIGDMEGAENIGGADVGTD
jgi:hypothetical protein